MYSPNGAPVGVYSSYLSEAPVLWGLLPTGVWQLVDGAGSEPTPRLICQMAPAPSRRRPGGRAPA